MPRRPSLGLRWPRIGRRPDRTGEANREILTNSAIGGPSHARRKQAHRLLKGPGEEQNLEEDLS
jgi:hypothetical protein